MHQVIKNIHKKRIVNVKGVPGIGKTTLIKAVAHYLDERHIMRDGIIMLSLRNLDKADMILTRLELLINKRVKDFINDSDRKDDPTKVVDQQAILEKISGFFKDKNILFILDNAETPSKKDPKNFTEII
jgi:adenylate kinase